MKRFLVAAAAAASVAYGSLAFAADSSAAKTFIDTTATQVLGVVKNEGMSKTDKQTKIESIFSDKVDINFVAKFVLGKAWRTATPQQQDAYIAAYKPFILKNYAQKLTKYSGQTYTLKNAHADADATVVTMEIDDPNGQKVNVDYRLHDAGGSLKIFDIAVEGVSLLTTQRSEFNGIVENKGVDGLTEALKTQVASKSAD